MTVDRTRLAEEELAAAEAALAELRERRRRGDTALAPRELVEAARRLVAARRAVSNLRGFEVPRRRWWPPRWS